MRDHHEDQPKSRGMKILLWLITPEAQVDVATPRIDIERMRVVMGSLLVSSISAAFALVLLTDFPYGFVYIVPELLLIASYFVGRFYDYRLGARFLVMVLLLIPVVILIVEQLNETPASSLIITEMSGVVLIGILISNLVNSIRYTLTLMGLSSIIVIGVTVLLSPTIQSVWFLLTILIVYIIIGTLIGFTAYISQRERQKLAEEIHNNQLNQRRIEQLLQHSPDLIAIRADGEYRYINEKGAELLGIDAVDDFIGKPMPDFRVMEEGETSGQFQRVLLKENSMTLRYISDIRRMDGTLFSADIVNTVLIHEGTMANMIFARPQYGIATRAKDNTPVVAEGMASKALPQNASSREAQPALKDVDVLARFLTFSHDVGYILRVDANGTIHLVWQDPTFATGLGYAEDVAAFPFEARLHPDDKAFWRTTVLEACQAEPHPIDAPLLDQIFRIQHQATHDYHVFKIKHASSAQLGLSGASASGASASGASASGDAEDGVTIIYGMMQETTQATALQEMLYKIQMKQAMLAELGALVLSTYDYERVFSPLALLIEQLSDIDFCAVYKRDMRYARWERMTISQYVPTPAQAYTGENASIFDAIYEVGETILLDDARQNTMPDDLTAQDLSTGVVVPLRFDGEEQWLLVILSNKTLTDSDYDFLKASSYFLHLFIKETHHHILHEETLANANLIRDARVRLYPGLSIEAVLATTQEYLHQIMPDDVQTILLLTTPKQSASLSVRAVWGFADNTQALKTLQQKDYGSVPCLEAIRRDLRPIIQDALGDKNDHVQWVNALQDTVISTFMAVPIFIGERFFGAIITYSMHPNVLLKRHLDIVYTFAEKIAFALQNTAIKEDLETRVQHRTEQFREERQQLQAILDATGEGIVYIENNVILFANESMTDLIGYPLDFLVGQPLINVLTKMMSSEEKRRLVATYQQLYGQNARTPRQDNWRDEVTLKNNHGDVVYAGFTLSPLGNESEIAKGGRIRAVIVLHDITAQKLLAEQKTRFIANAAHELRSPLATVNTRVYLMRKNPEQLLEKHMPLLERSVNRITRLVNDLLDLSSFENGRTRIKTDLLVIQDVLQEVITMEETRAEGANVIFSYEIEDEPLVLVGDADRLYQVFSNLVVNAIHYTPEGGTVTMTMRHHPDDEQVKIIVEDTGEGISAEDLDNIFVPFFRATTAKVGTGLGLSIAQEIIHLHHGTIEVQSDLNTGSKFTVTLPTSLVRSLR